MTAQVGHNSFSPDPHDRDHLREQWRLAALEWAKLEDVASRMEEGRRIVLAEIELELVQAGMAVNKAERHARVSDRFKSYVRDMHAARKAANIAKIETENMNRIYWQHATSEANQRAEMRLSR